MPELPEVEITRLSFAKKITNARIVKCYLGLSLRWELGCNPSDLVGYTIENVTRRGKYIVIHIKKPNLKQNVKETPSLSVIKQSSKTHKEQPVLLLHLGMSGSLRFMQDQKVPLGKHDHVALHTTNGVLILNDPRRFGAFIFSPSLQGAIVQKLLGNLGLEPLSSEFSLKEFFDRLQRRKIKIKQALLAGDIVVGVGNIYASEALFLARIHPQTLTHQMDQKQVERLRLAIIEVLEHALKLGGSTLKNFSDATGKVGHFQLQAAVYNRENQPCFNCKTPIERMIQNHRSTYFCSKCQK